MNSLEDALAKILESISQEERGVIAEKLGVTLTEKMTSDEIALAISAIPIESIEWLEQQARKRLSS